MTSRPGRRGRSKIGRHLLAAGLTLSVGYAFGAFTLGGCGGSQPGFASRAGGPLPEHVVQSLRDCGERAPAPGEPEKHTVAFDVFMDSDGLVEHVARRSSTLHTDEVEACMERALGALSERTASLSLRRREPETPALLPPEGRALLGHPVAIAVGVAEVVVAIGLLYITVVVYYQVVRGTKAKAMANRRQDLLNQLEAAAEKTPRVPEDFLLLSFQILYGLPSEMQLRAAVHMRERYLPIYETKLPGVTWPRQLLGDLDAWLRAEGEATPDGPDEIDSADRLYQSGFTDLLCAYRYRDDPACLTGGICSAMLGVIHARAENVFLADDAVAAQLTKEWRAWQSTEEERRPPEPESFHQLWQPDHNPEKNVAFIAVYRREWLHVVEWLRAEAVWKHPEPDDMHAMMRGLERWEAHELYSMAPERTEPESTGDRQA